ncbi:MAG: TetR/AcrR family transcriptional regulator [Myxococcota bacterium]
MSPKKVDRKELRRSEIIDAALVVFGRDGFGQATVDAIAKEAETAKGTVYLYFEGKEDLFQQAVRVRLLPVLETLEQLREEFQGSSFELLQEQIRLLFEKISGEGMRVILQLLIAEGPRFPELRTYYYRNVIQRFVDSLSKTLDTGIASGEFRPVSRETMARVLMGPSLLTGIWKILFDEFSPLDTREVLMTQLDLALRGLTTDPSASRSST